MTQLLNHFNKNQNKRASIFSLIILALVSISLTFLVGSCGIEKSVSPYEEEGKDDTQLHGSISGKVIDVYTGLGIGAINVTTVQGGQISLTDQNGNFTIPDVPKGTYTIRFQNPDFADTISMTISLAVDQDLTGIQITLRPLFRFFSGKIMGKDSLPLANVALNTGNTSAVTDANGTYLLKAKRTNDPVVLSHKLYRDSTVSPPTLAPSVSQYNLDLYMLYQKDGYVLGQVVDSTTGLGLPNINILSSSGHLTVTNDAGMYSLPVAPGTHTISIASNLYKTKQIPSVIVTPADTVRLGVTTLKRVNSGIGGTITDSKTGAPLSDILVTEPVSGITTKTLSDGSFFMADLPPGKYSLLLSHPLFADTSLVDLVLTASTIINGLTISMQPKLGSISGIVSDSLGNPISGVTISPDTGTSFTTLTDGRYTLVQLRPGKRILSIRHDKYRAMQDTLTLTVGQNVTGRNYTLKAFTSGISGYVFNAKNVTSMITGALVKQVPTGKEATTTNGAFQLSDLIAGNYTLNISHPDYFDTTLAPITLSTDQVINNVSVGLRWRWASMQFIVRDSVTQAAIEGVHCYLNDSLYHQTSNATGLVRFTGLSTSKTTTTEYRLTCSGLANYQATGIYTYKLSPSDSVGPMVILLKPNLGSITGVVSDSLGNPISGVTVSPDTGVSVTTLSDGRYTLVQLKPGKRILSLRHDKYRSKTDTLILVAGQNVTGRNYTLKAFTSGISGIIYDVKNPSIMITGALVKQLPTGKEATTSNGAFQLSDLIAGNYTIGISHKDYFDTVLAPIALATDQIINDLSIGLRWKWASMQFVLRDSTTQTPVEGVICNLNDDANISVISNASGQVKFTGLATAKTGPTEYRLRCSGHSEFQATPYYTYNVNPGDSLSSVTIELKPYLGMIGGIILDSSTSLPVDQAKITLENGTNTTTLPNGRWKISGLRAGKWKFTIQNNVYEPRVDSITIAAGVIDTLHSNKLLKMISGINGNVTDSKNGSTISNVLVTDIITNSQATTSGGGYTFANLSPGTHTLKFTHANYLDTTLAPINLVANTPQTINVAMRWKWATVDIQVKDSLTNTVITNSSPSCKIDGGAQYPAPSGTARINYIAAGSHNVSCEDNKYYSWTKILTLNSGDSISPVIIKLYPRPASVSGSVINGSGAGLANATITLGSKTTTTNVNGLYTITDILPGPYTIQVSLTDYISKSEALTLSAAEVVNSKNFTLEKKTSTISGKLTNRTTGANLVNDTAWAYYNGVRESYTITDANGNYTLSPRYTGTYKVKFINAANICNPESLTIAVVLGNNNTNQNASLVQVRHDVNFRSSFTGTGISYVKLRITGDNLSQTIVDVNIVALTYDMHTLLPTSGTNRKVETLVYDGSNRLMGYKSQAFTSSTNAIIVQTPIFRADNAKAIINLFPGELNKLDTTITTNDSIRIRMSIVDSFNTNGAIANPNSPSGIRYQWKNWSQNWVDISGPNVMLPGPSANAGEVFPCSLRVIDSENNITGVQYTIKITKSILSLNTCTLRPSNLTEWEVNNGFGWTRAHVSAYTDHPSATTNTDQYAWKFTKIHIIPPGGQIPYDITYEEGADFVVNIPPYQGVFTIYSRVFDVDGNYIDCNQTVTVGP